MQVDNVAAMPCVVSGVTRSTQLSYRQMCTRHLVRIATRGTVRAPASCTANSHRQLTVQAK